MYLVLMSEILLLIFIGYLSSKTNQMNSVHSANVDEIHDMPMNAITRPIPSILDNEKVESLMETISKVCSGFTDINYET